MTRRKVRQTIAEYLKSHQELTYKQVAAKLNCGLSTVGNIAREFGITRQRKALSDADLTSLEG
jgi:DNA invertase Pin-like site-specific DNA recombinase